ncbi:MAG: acetyl-CoA carboxylase biotin carboxylase subunit [Ignavibacteria bacterium]|nr:acetyl-CoA carboxylase biotin carboxylase subunit [Ignavibacteria bacterium]MCU7499654.1 acetyl-CoA carboxylase biotin carboxylase subunit [Ignavibacteria bacterium]MCU7512905.1 acetyl-CoA carboxylase biotin carboxylase subunit [Ignavibacteria bacterium]MCU7521417.1 acetyl-CoA carboxylase biotin carboxylase subunit [Ignavibacteria bacterium]MCU7524649.1 acetyl-CoA carboxylase biotin carboxylase subunit [Ignavibacteria bacterium]
MIKKILIVNRGEIAVRIIKACRELSITSACLYSEADKDSLHVRLADEAYFIGPSPSSESYLNIPKIIDLAKKINASAIHPGYGFLSENADFIKAVEDSGIIFIGPESKSVRLMGDKTSARRLMSNSNVPIVPGTTSPITSIEEGKKTAREIGYPILLKASAGGGGKGMRKVSSEEDFEPSLSAAQNEAQKAFGNPEVYIEKFIENPKHIEVQIIADRHGSYAHLFERDCSVQRRHQKVIEEAPSTFVDEALREKLTTAAINAARACGYYNAGTIEFLVDKNKNFYFLEMNTRLQVEHPVTELITGLDLVKEQIGIAEGKPLSFKQEDISIHGHAIECRIYAEDVDNNFVPSTGHIKLHRRPDGIGIRVDTGIDPFSNVSMFYDPLLTKVIAWDRTRQEAIERMKRALGEYKIAGVLTNIAACRWVLKQEQFINGSFDINFVEDVFIPLIPDKWKSEQAQEYEDAVSILAVLLKSKMFEPGPTENKVPEGNKWTGRLYE